MKICIPIKEKTLERAQKQVKKASKYADFIEIWLDCFGRKISDSDLKKLIKSAKTPVIAVCKGNIEKGSFRGTEQERIGILEKAVICSAKLVDCGMHTNRKLLLSLKKTCKRHNAKLIISKHFWGSTPSLSDLLKTFAEAKKLGADIIKIAVTITKLSDNAILFELTSRLKEKGEKVIMVGMGEKGKIGRIGCALIGGYLTYVALDEISKTAKGQMTIKEFNLKVKMQNAK